VNLYSRTDYSSQQGNSEAICPGDGERMHVCFSGPSDSIIKFRVLTLERVFKSFNNRLPGIISWGMKVSSA